ncbi:hypothetical protein J2X68_000736 [Streptomyces sp. 3330]|uniref:hypothetical protein n=1 Tax=Streptomyces sp. 3330 TaxID=2817755 RepID=UPI00285BC925|nr:hypothetical protein [Streptomyces sp. 3330]MDR6974058.1 hypothetical protein [Streptomyces sp. 3330]
MLTRSAVMVCSIAALALAGCSSGGDEGRAAEPPDETVVTATVSGAPSSPASSSVSPSGSASSGASASVPASAGPSPVPVTGPDQKLVTMTVSGGFAGVNRQVVLRGDGTVRTTDSGASAERRTTAAQFTTLRTLLGDPALDDVPAFAIDMGSADKFQYTLQFDGRTVMTDRSTDAPALDRLIGALEKWLPAN